MRIKRKKMKRQKERNKKRRLTKKHQKRKHLRRLMHKMVKEQTEMFNQFYEEVCKQEKGKNNLC